MGIDYRLGIEATAPYLQGEKLWGEDLPPERVDDWYRNEAEAYADLASGSANAGVYLSFARDEMLGWSRLPAGRVFTHALGIGSAYGEEFAPMAKRITQLTILEPSDKFVGTSVHGIPSRYVKPAADGSMPFEREQFDLIVAFACLHHVAKVSQVIDEIARVLMPGGFVLICEPIVSMGDFTQPRSGATPHERGLPVPWLREHFKTAGLRVESERFCGFTPFQRLAPRLIGKVVDNSPIATRIDRWLSAAFSWNYRYRRQSNFHRMAPHNCFYVLTK